MVNVQLQRLSGGHMGPSPDELDAVYQVELVQQCRAPGDATRRYYLRLLRQEKIMQEHGLTDQSNAGGQEIVSCYTIQVKNGVCGISISTYRALNVYQQFAWYEHRKFASFLSHVLIYCCVCASLQLQVEAVHPATMHLFAKYEKFTTNVHEMDAAGRISEGFSVGRVLQYLFVTLDAS